MSAEHHQEHAEKHEGAHEELETARREKLEELRGQPEAAPENAHERAEEARKVIHKQERAHEEPPPATEAAPAQPGISLPFMNHKLNYAQTLTSVQRRLGPVSRSFSKVIHAPAVEKASEALEQTLARPSVTFGATWTALIVGGIFYFTARHYGYALPGSEITLSFFVGALIGLGIEGLWRKLGHPKHRH